MKCSVCGADIIAEDLPFVIDGMGNVFCKDCDEALAGF